MNTKYSSCRARQIKLEVEPTSSTFTSEDTLLTSKQVALMIGKSEAWLARKRWEGGGIPYRKIERHVRYQLSVVLRWLNSHPEMTSTSNEN